MIRGGLFASPAELERFRTEARAAARLNHPHIVPIHELGEYEGQPYFTMTLVEGGDLTVRDRRVFIKTLEGLQPVDVILRRIDDTFCDPLELRADSFLGTPGLVQAARAGGVAIANALGSGLAESPALMAFLPRLCQRLLGGSDGGGVPFNCLGGRFEVSGGVAYLRRLVIDTPRAAQSERPKQRSRSPAVRPGARTAPLPARHASTRC